MIDMDDDDNWAMADEAEDEDMESNQVVGETSLDRLAIALGGRAVLTPCLQLVNEMLKNSKRKSFGAEKFEKIFLNFNKFLVFVKIPPPPLRLIRLPSVRSSYFKTIGLVLAKR